jgi:excisionase family DNA binding protein
MEDLLLSVPEVARRLGGISPWTVHAWLSQGRLQRTKVGGRTMIRESELQKVIQDGGKSSSSARQGRGARARVEEASGQPILKLER